MRDLLFAFSVVICTATQLRVPGSPIGIGEVTLGIWLVWTILTHARGFKGPSPALVPVSLFWTVIFIAESIGLVKGMSTELFFDTPSIFHDVFAYSLLFSVAALLSVELASPEARRATSWRVLLFGTGMLSLELANGYGAFSIPVVEPWYFDRLRGWSHDPNQLGFMCANLVLLSVYAAGLAARIPTRACALACGVLAGVTGVLTQSDSFTVSIAAGAAIYLGMQGLIFLYARTLNIRSVAASVFLLAAPFVALSAVPFIPTVIRISETYSENMYDDNNQGDARVKLWKEAIAKGLEADLLGYGPGPHLTAKSFKRPPPDKFEAHNVIFELFTQGGMLASASFIVLMLFILSRTIAAQTPSAAAMTLAYIVFSMFHYEIRHPIFWFGVVLCLSEAASALKSRPRLRCAEGSGRAAAIPLTPMVPR